MPRGRRKKIEGPGTVEGPSDRLTVLVREISSELDRRRKDFDDAKASAAMLRQAADLFLNAEVDAAGAVMAVAVKKVAAAKTGGGGHKGSSPVRGHACCGSKGSRHKNGCTNSGSAPAAKKKDPLFDQEDDDEKPPAVRNGRAKSYGCLDGHTFMSVKSLEELKEEGCPIKNCGQKTIMEKG